MAGAAIVGLVGAAGVFIYEQIYAEKRRAMLGDTVDAPDQSYASDSEYFTDYQSVIATDGEMDSEEFYDVPTDDEDDTLRESLRNGHAAKLTLDEDKSDKLDLPVQQNIKENST
ncbi:hypothetical protein RR46_12455 [Papilio xuthus]|uniref:Uncharacterized protein n=1 Tax=Papilio xuthus TaxID=66420 RepID=A0A194PZ41_PAPXU|nr:hypothetical protein RR46_12455 [Papilio xuthus]